MSALAVTGASPLIAAGIRKYSIGSFFLLLVVIKTGETEIILEMEQILINELNPEYNLCPVAGSNKGLKRSPETRARVSASKKGSKNPQFGKVGVNAKELFLFVVTDKGNSLLLSFPSITLAAKTLGVLNETVFSR